MNKKRSLFFDTSLIYFVVILSFVSVRILSSLVSLKDWHANLLSLIIQVGIMLFIPFLMYKLMRKKNTKEVLLDFHVKKINIKAILFAIGIGVVVYFLNIAVANFFDIFIYNTGYDPSFGMASATGGIYTWQMFVSDIILSAILPGICEEFCHRGLLLNGYKQLGAKKTILLVGFIFGLMHLNIEQFFYASVIGMFLTFLVYVSGSIIPSMIVHFLNNAIGIYMSFAQHNNLPLGNFSKNLTEAMSGNIIGVFGLIILCVCLLIGLLVFFTMGLLKNTRVKNFQTLAQKAVDKKQREEILQSFDLNVDELNKQQGIVEERNDAQVFIGPPVIRNGRPNVFVDFKFDETSLMSNVVKKPSLKDKAFLFGTIFIGIVITISTLIWGII